VLGQGDPVLSPQDLVSFDTADHGCNGGSVLNVWDDIDSNGIRSDECVPYISRDGIEEARPAVCSESGSSTRHKCPVPSSSLDSDLAIQQAVMTVGALEVGFSVYEDFMNYESGIYCRQAAQYLCDHAVKVVGWKKHFSTFYWVVQNSWGPDWGENGFFRIVNCHGDMNSCRWTCLCARANSGAANSSANATHLQ